MTVSSSGHTVPKVMIKTFSQTTCKVYQSKSILQISWQWLPRATKKKALKDAVIQFFDRLRSKKLLNRRVSGIKLGEPRILRSCPIPTTKWRHPTKQVHRDSGSGRLRDLWSKSVNWFILLVKLVFNDNMNTIFI